MVAQAKLAGLCHRRPGSGEPVCRRLASIGLGKFQIDSNALARLSCARFVGGLDRKQNQMPKPYSLRLTALLVLTAGALSPFPARGGTEVQPGSKKMIELAAPELPY